MKKVVSFQIVQGFGSSVGQNWTPDVIVLCEDGSLWLTSLTNFRRKGCTDWIRLTPELAESYSEPTKSYGVVS